MQSFPPWPFPWPPQFIIQLSSELGLPGISACLDSLLSDLPGIASTHKSALLKI